MEYLCFRKEIVCHPNRTENTSDQGPLPLGKTEGTENLIFVWNTLGMNQLNISLSIVFFQPHSISLYIDMNKQKDNTNPKVASQLKSLIVFVVYHLIVAYKARFPLFHTKRIFYLNLKLDCSLSQQSDYILWNTYFKFCLIVVKLPVPSMSLS